MKYPSSHSFNSTHFTGSPPITECVINDDILLFKMFRTCGVKWSFDYIHISFMCMIWWLSSFGFFESYEQMKSHTLKSFNHIRNCWLISGIWCPSMLRVLWISSHVFWHLAKELNLKRCFKQTYVKEAPLSWCRVTSSLRNTWV